MKFFDIETMWDERPLPDPDVRLGNIKDPAKIKEREDLARSEQLKTIALNPLHSRLACYCVYNGGYVSRIIAGKDDESERLLLQDFWKDISDPPWCSWNGKNFDVPFVYRRSIILGVKPSVPMSLVNRKYDMERHLDLRQLWTGFNDYEKGSSLDKVCTVVLGHGKVDCPVDETYKWIANDEYGKRLLEYNKQDVSLLVDLYNKFDGVLF